MSNQLELPLTRLGDSRRPPIQLSLIDLILAATESSEDPSEINDGIADLIRTGAVRILPRKQDPMLRRMDPGETPLSGSETGSRTAALPAPHPLAL